MIKLEFLNKYAKELYLKIIIDFKPTHPSLNLNDEVEKYAAENSFTLSTIEHEKLLKQTKKNLKKIC